MGQTDPIYVLSTYELALKQARSPLYLLQKLHTLKYFSRQKAPTSFLFLFPKLETAAKWQS